MIHFLKLIYVIFIKVSHLTFEDMKKVKGKIILIDDGKFEKDFLEESLDEKNWSINVDYFDNPEKALSHLKKNSDEIFLIISDMNMPKMSGLDLKKNIDSDPYLRKKSIPFIFASTDVSQDVVSEAYYHRVQGFFKKPSTIDEYAEMIERIIQYWKSCIHPNNKLSLV